MISVVTPCRTLLSAFGLIGKTKSEWGLMSMNPGATTRPSASMTLFASAGGTAVFLDQDVTEEARWSQIIADAETRFGRLDVMVANAGIGLLTSLEEM